MSEPDLKAHIEAIRLATKAAKLRKLMPSIEARLAEGARTAQIVEALRKGGLDLTLGTFRNYLHQYRAKQGKSGRPQVEPVGSPSANVPASFQPSESVSYVTELEPLASDGPVSMQELDRLMKPDPAKLA